MVLWAVAKLGVEPGPAVKPWSNCVVKRRPNRQVSKLLWALAKLGVDPGPELADAMLRRATAVAWEFTAPAVFDRCLTTV